MRGFAGKSDRRKSRKGTDCLISKKVLENLRKGLEREGMFILFLKGTREKTGASQNKLSSRESAIGEK